MWIPRREKPYSEEVLGNSSNQIYHISHSVTSLPSGHFLVLDIPIDPKIQVVGRLHSPVVLAGVEECTLRFWYQVLGEKPGVINVYR